MRTAKELSSITYDRVAEVVLEKVVIASPWILQMQNVYILKFRGLTIIHCSFPELFVVCCVNGSTLGKIRQ